MNSLASAGLINFHLDRRADDMLHHDDRICTRRHRGSGSHFEGFRLAQ